MFGSGVRVMLASVCVVAMPVVIFAPPALAGSSMAAAQPLGSQREQHPIVGVRAPLQWYTDSAVTRSCPSFVLTDSAAFDEGPPVRSWCNVDTSYALPNADRTRWLTVVYRRSFEYPADSVQRTIPGTTLDTLVRVTAVLYTHRDHMLSWGPEWMGTVPQEITWSVRVHATERPDRSMLVGIRYCINGTGGCWQRYLRRQDGKWSAVEELFWRQIPPIPGGRIGKGVGIDVATLSGSYGVYAAADGNCCPSREIFLRLELRGDTLTLASYELRRTARQAQPGP